MKGNILFCAVMATVLTVAHIQTAFAKEKVLYPIHECGAEGSSSSFMISGFKNYPPFSWSELDKNVLRITGFKQYNYNGFILDSVKSALNDIHVKKIKDVFFDDFQQMQIGRAHV